MAPTKILFVEDDNVIAAYVAGELARMGYAVSRSATAAAALPEAWHVDAIVLDRVLPDGDAIEALAEWRAAGLVIPVLVLSSLGELRDRLAGLDAGADDYLAKPFHVTELDARLRALLRMQARLPKAEPDVLACGALSVDRRRREARRDGVLITLQPREFKLLEELALHAGEVVTRAQLLERVWNLRFDPRTKLIETHVSRLRDKLAFAGFNDPIETVRGTGYRLRADD